LAEFKDEKLPTGTINFGAKKNKIIKKELDKEIISHRHVLFKLFSAKLKCSSLLFHFNFLYQY
jgi:hypothetical protein